MKGGLAPAAGEKAPQIPGLRTDDWAVENPKGKPVEQVREIRDEVKQRVLDLIAADGLPKAGAH